MSVSTGVSKGWREVVCLHQWVITWASEGLSGPESLVGVLALFYCNRRERERERERERHTQGDSLYAINGL